MPIKDLQMRMRQLGEIRIGRVVDTGRVSQKTGKPILRPEKLSKFRFTSPSKPILEQVATLYGGTVQPWTPANGGPQEWEVFSTSDRLPILIPPRNAVSQWYELYAGSRCIRRCDGEVEQKSDQSCMCNPAKRQCSITTRVNVMLRDVPALGQWLLISKGYYAGTTLPDAAELLALVGGYVPGWLGMEEKSVQRDEGPSRFMVPTIDVDITPRELMAGQISDVAAKAELAVPERPAIEAPSEEKPPPDYLSLAGMARDAETVRGIYKTAVAKGHMTIELRAGLAEVTKKLEAAAAAKAPADAPSAPEPDDDVVEAEIVDDEVVADPTALWVQIVTVAGGFGWSMQQVEDKFAEANGGTMPGSAEASELRAYLEKLRSQAAGS